MRRLRYQPNHYRTSHQVRATYPTPHRHLSWKNEDNNTFYMHANLQEYCRQAGLESCPDMRTIYHHLPYTPTKVLEVGGGYGRTIDWLLQKPPVTPSITTIERNHRFTKTLERKFNDHPNVTIINDNVLKYNFTEQYDLISALWCAINEFNGQERWLLLTTLYQQLKPGKAMVFDLPPEDLSKSNITDVNNEELKIIIKEEKRQATWHGQIVTEKQLVNLAKEALPDCNTSTAKYFTDNLKQRTLAFIWKNDKETTEKNEIIPDRIHPAF